MTDVGSIIDALIEKDCYLIDIFPSTVPETKDRRYFCVEEYFQAHREGLNAKFCNILLKLYCYYDFWLFTGEENRKNPSPEQLARCICRCFEGGRKTQDGIHLILPDCDALIFLNGDDLYMSLYNPDQQLMELVSKLAGAEGLFFYKATER